MLVKPGPNPDGPDGMHRVRIPHSHALLSPEGQQVPESRFWRRRLRDGDVVEVKTEPEIIEVNSEEHAT